jgi:hypothetical protein
VAHFAELDENNIVTRVVVVSNDIKTSDGPLGDNDMHIDGETWCSNFFKGGTWKQTSYSSNFRKQYAGIGFTYNATDDIFIEPKPFNSWTLDSNNEWQAPDTKPTTAQSTYDYNGQDRLYKVDWDETRQKWQGLKQEDYEEGGSQTVYNWNSSSNTWEVV